MVLHDLKLLKVRIFGKLRRISQMWQVTTAKRMKIDPNASESVVTHYMYFSTSCCLH